METVNLKVTLQEAKQLREILNLAISNAESKSKTPFNIIINGIRFLVSNADLNYKKLCQAYYIIENGTIIYPFLDEKAIPIQNLTITYSNGPIENPQGLIKPDKDYVVKEHMHFHIVDTSKA